MSLFKLASGQRERKANHNSDRLTEDMLQIN